MTLLPFVILIGSQLLFTTSDLNGRWAMVRYGFSVASFVSIWFLVYFAVRMVGTFGQLYVLSQMEIGKSIALFGVVGIVLANVLGLLVLKEALSPVPMLARCWPLSHLSSWFFASRSIG